MLHENNIRAGYGKAHFVREIAPEIASKIACANGPLHDAILGETCVVSQFHEKSFAV